jgi:myosin heavy subunit
LQNLLIYLYEGTGKTLQNIFTNLASNRKTQKNLKKDIMIIRICDKIISQSAIRKEVGGIIMNNSKMKIIALAAIPCAIALVWAIITNVNLSAAKSELKQTQADLTKTQTELTSTKQQLTDVKTELSSTQDTLSSTRITLSQTQSQLDSTKIDLGEAQTALGTAKNQLTIAQGQLASANTDLASAKTQLTDTQSQLASSMQQLSDANKVLAGLHIAVHSSPTAWAFNGLQWVHSDNTNAANPTWAGLLSFIAKDKTDQNPYNLKTFNCVNYATTVYNNAEAQGLETAMVTISLRSANGLPIVGHAINAFITSDYGLVWVDCTGSDAISSVIQGKAYRAVDTNGIQPAQLNNNTWWQSLTGNYYYLPDTYGGQAVVDSIDIYW